jgi:hypothetical protein
MISSLVADPSPALLDTLRAALRELDREARVERVDGGLRVESCLGKPQIRELLLPLLAAAGERGELLIKPAGGDCCCGSCG